MQSPVQRRAQTLDQRLGNLLETLRINDNRAFLPSHDEAKRNFLMLAKRVTNPLRLPTESLYTFATLGVPSGQFGAVREYMLH